MKKVLTLAVLHNGKHVLLGLKKRGFGEGRWNGFGGKVQPGETIETAALRELKEEADIAIPSLNKRGIITFNFEGNPEALEVHIFSAPFNGEGKESDEMKPQWFSFADIPYAAMWPDDELWLPLLLSGKNFSGEVFFKDMNTILRHTIQESAIC
jgi:8-oxo-dGTP diphosphatase / 2-hydroxy-dATP diphosphatase